jgi:hypothetical protein
VYIVHLFMASRSPSLHVNRTAEKLKPEGKSVFCSPVACSAVQCRTWASDSEEQSKEGRMIDSEAAWAGCLTGSPLLLHACVAAQ